MKQLIMVWIVVTSLFVHKMVFADRLNNTQKIDSQEYQEYQSSIYVKSAQAEIIIMTAFITTTLGIVTGIVIEKCTVGHSDQAFISGSVIGSGISIFMIFSPFILFDESIKND